MFQKNIDGETPLMDASYNGNEDSVRALLDLSARVNDVSKVSIDGHTHASLCLCHTLANMSLDCNTF